MLVQLLRTKFILCEMRYKKNIFFMNFYRIIGLVNWMLKKLGFSIFNNCPRGRELWPKKSKRRNQKIAIFTCWLVTGLLVEWWIFFCKNCVLKSAQNVEHEILPIIKAKNWVWESDFLKKEKRLIWAPFLDLFFLIFF